MNKKIIDIKEKDKKIYSSILVNDPGNYEALLKLGLTHVNEKEFLLAKEKFSKLIEVNKFRYEGYLNLSNIYILQGDVSEANKILNNYLDSVEANTEIINALAINYLNAKEYSDLDKHINKYIDKHKSHILYFLKGYTLSKIDNLSQSETYFKKSINLNSSFWNSYELLMKQYEKQSRLDDLKELINIAKKIFNKNLMLCYYEALCFFRLKDYNKSLEILNDKENKTQFLSQQNYIVLADYYHLLSRNNEKLGSFNQSYEFAIKRNQITLNLPENRKFKKELILDTITSYKIFFNLKKYNKPKKISVGLSHSNLTFLIGFPRSGTTLLDTILRSHSKTVVLEEKPYLLDIRHQFYKDHQLKDMLEIQEEKKIKMQKTYFDSFDYQSDKIIIDKYPLNLIELGFIKILFPNSKIILAIRHPLDCIISCVLTSFKMNDGMVNFENIHTTSHFYNECFDLLYKYFDYFEINFHQIKYENVILNFNDEIKKLLNFLNLNFEKNIINFNKTAMEREKINTPSYDQVVQPIYSSSINRYKNFNEISNIKTDISFWLNKFSY